MNILTFYQLDYQGVDQLTGTLDLLERKPTNMFSKTIIPEQFKADVESLGKYSGLSVTPGMTIQMSLQEALKVIPRKRARIDSYKPLVDFLRDEMGVNLILNSRKNKIK